ncbi:MAG TPA: secretin N-terminal domain-containing protein [Halanaerobiales bacterium]|nr:secretin N-terminal domain-containing protein [Halanaerobiales bacterium]
MKNNKRKITFIMVSSLIIISLLSFSIAAVVEGEIRNMNFKGADIRDVLTAIAEVAEVNLISDSSVTGSITIHLREISFNEALNLITQTTGLAYKWDGNTVVVATPGRIEEVYKEMELEILNFDSKDLNRAKEVLNSVYPELNIQIIKENTQLLLVGKEETIEEAVQLVNRVDFPDIITEEEKVAEVKEKEAEDVLEIIKIEYGNLSEIVDNLKVIYPELIVQTDTNNNQIILKGEQDYIDEAKDLISRVDIPTQEDKEVAESEKLAEEEAKKEAEDQVTKYAKIYNIDEEELISKVKSTYPDIKISYDEVHEHLEIKGDDEKVSNTLTLIDRYDDEQQKRTEIIGIDYVNLDSVSSIVEDSVPEVNLNKNELTREIIISGNTMDVERAVNLIENLDIPRRQVIIEARLEEISMTETSSMGISNPENNLPTIEFIKDPMGQIEGITGTWPDYISALKSEGKAETLANPRLMTLNGEEGNMLIGEQIPVKGIDAEGKLNITYIEAGINLNFTPWITKENYIELEVTPKVSSLGEELYEGFPAIRTREVTTKLRLKDGQSFAIAGLIQEDVKNSERKVPLLSEIPILGKLFRYDTDNTEKTELVIFITPRIVEDKQREEVKEKVQPLNSEKEKEEYVFIEPESEESDKEQQAETKSVSTEQEEVKTSQPKGYQDLSSEELAEILNTSRRQREYINELPDSLEILYAVPSDQSAQEIADKFTLPADEIIKNLEDKNEFKKGDLVVLSIPSSHLIKVDENQDIDSILGEYDISLEEILELNQLESADEIEADMLLISPRAIR